MRYLFSRIPAAALFAAIDGHTYARIPHKLSTPDCRIVEDYETPAMIRFESPSHIRNGEAHVLFAKVGDAIDLGHIPFSVTAEQRDDEGRIRPAPTMYATREASGLVALRQSCYAAQLARGNEHPHDVCAVARDLAELRGMCDKHWPDADYSRIDTEPQAAPRRSELYRHPGKLA